MDIYNYLSSKGRAPRGTPLLVEEGGPSPRWVPHARAPRTGLSRARAWVTVQGGFHKRTPSTKSIRAGFGLGYSLCVCVYIFGENLFNRFFLKSVSEQMHPFVTKSVAE